MKVKLIGQTTYPASICGISAKTCTSEDIPSIGDLGIGSALEHAIKSGHESVLEHASFTFAIEGISRACSHQLVRHRMASYSQQSQRYTKSHDYVMPKTLKGKIVENEQNQLIGCTEVMDDLFQFYRQLIEDGVPEEDARYILPNACCTNIVVTMNARELRHFFGLRCCTRAQWEIRELADKMLELCKHNAPLLFEDVGAQCEKLGYCPEARGCGKYPKKDVA